MFRIVLSCLAHSGLAHAESPLQQRRFGVQVHCDGMTECASPPMQDICVAAQVTRNGCWWRYVEKVKGQYDFTHIDAWVKHTNSTTGSSCAAGPNQPMQMNFVLNGGNHLYGGEDSTSPTTQEQVDGYTNFAVATIKQYAGQGIIWELYNEPDLSVRNMTASQYAALVISVGKAVRSNPAISSEILMGPSMSVISCDYAQQMKSLGVFQYVDAVSVHGYVAGAPEQTRWQFEKIKDIVGPGTALVSGEWGWSTCTSDSGTPANCLGGTKPDIVSLSDQAMYIARQWLIHALDRIPMSIYYEWMNDGSGTEYDKTQCEYNWGMRMAHNGAAKPSYHAAVAVQTYIGRRPFLSQLSTHGSKDMEFVLAFGAAGSGPPPVAAAGLEAGSAEMFAVWTLSTEGGTSRQTGSRDTAYCGGDALWTGMASDCHAKCVSIAGCRGYVSYATGSVHSGSNCQLTGSRCTTPRPISGCGINIWRQECPGGPGVHSVQLMNQTEREDPACDSAKAYTLIQSPTPPPIVFTNPAGARFKCYSAFDVLGESLPQVCAASDGTITVKATESPIYLLGVGEA